MPHVTVSYALERVADSSCPRHDPQLAAEVAKKFLGAKGGSGSDGRSSPDIGSDGKTSPEPEAGGEEAAPEEGGGGEGED